MDGDGESFRYCGKPFINPKVEFEWVGEDPGECWECGRPATIVDYTRSGKCVDRTCRLGKHSSSILLGKAYI